jgi:hypothetical protein
MSPGGTVKLTIDGRETTVPAGTSLFDAARVDPATLTVTGPAGTGRVNVDAKGALRAVLQDIDADGDLDLMAYFLKASVFGADNVGQPAYTVTLEGNLKTVAGDAKRDGRPIRGTDRISLTP